MIRRLLNLLAALFSASGPWDRHSQEQYWEMYTKGGVSKL